MFVSFGFCCCFQKKKKQKHDDRKLGDRVIATPADRARVRGTRPCISLSADEGKDCVWLHALSESVNYEFPFDIR